jgi:hypothetical protein
MRFQPVRSTVHQRRGILRHVGAFSSSEVVGGFVDSHLSDNAFRGFDRDDDITKQNGKWKLSDNI